MAEEKKERKIVKVSEDGAKKTESGKTIKEAKPVGNAGGLRCGAIICWLVAICFEVLGFLILTDKQNKLDKKTKAIAVVVGIIALLIGGLASYDWNPISAEQKEAAMQTIDGDVYWTPFGKVYHTSADCQHLNNSDTLYEGTVEEAIAANKSRLCKTCADRDSIAGVYTEGE